MHSVKSYCEKMNSDQLKGILRDCCHGFLDIAEPVLPVMLDILSARQRAPEEKDKACITTELFRGDTCLFASFLL